MEDLWAHHSVSEHYLHEARQLLAIKRGNVWIAGNFGQRAQKIPEALVEGRKLLASTEKNSYGYLGKRTRGARVGGFALKVWG